MQIKDLKVGDILYVLDMETRKVSKEKIVEIMSCKDYILTRQNPIVKVEDLYHIKTDKYAYDYIKGDTEHYSSIRGCDYFSNREMLISYIQSEIDVHTDIVNDYMKSLKEL